jgi:hypothetical protein
MTFISHCLLVENQHFVSKNIIDKCFYITAHFYFNVVYNFTNKSSFHCDIN